MRNHTSTATRRILIVIRRLGIGGIEQATLTLANALAGQGHDVHLLVLKGQPKQTPASNVTVHCRDFERHASRTLPGLAYLLLSRTLLKALLPGSGFVWQGRLVSRYFQDFLGNLETEHGKFDQILIRGQGAFEMLWKVDDPRCWRVVEAVTGRFHHRLLCHWLTRTLYSGKQVICVSQGVANELSTYLGGCGVSLQRQEVIHNAVPIDHVRQLSKANVMPEILSPYLVHVARLVPVKQQSLLLEAYHQARQAGLDMPLVMIGGGSERTQLEAQAKQLGIDHQVHFLGQQENPYPWMAQATALVLSSRCEGLGLVLIEALALSTACVATDAPGGIREVLIEEQQRLIADQTPESLAAKMLEAVNDPVKVQPAWAERFDEVNICQRFLDLIAPARVTSDTAMEMP
ncbi:hypothetical protein L861_02035 [Litchfieldella anticariensis FP35 = DSM 16096]|uniref:Glycosyl transferase family 1 domain-containing protein n=1 Tax=Litchfieldella anticariensis (strain DSM 16096 / CECT 5854 / CIP 108499 / LMG 22089 / FP35) TaxID=1121939 RepID=S2KPT2_LITA3|nr:glycosyltransferase [Halomonas anticariensis]EPC04112.1 hypothetical protein L861_02035 [Halomonas anticariensis FP35 = DSM 16096]